MLSQTIEQLKDKFEVCLGAHTVNIILSALWVLCAKGSVREAMAEDGEPAVIAQQDDNGRTDGAEAGNVDHTDTQVLSPAGSCHVALSDGP